MSVGPALGGGGFPTTPINPVRPRPGGISPKTQDRGRLKRGLPPLGRDLGENSACLHFSPRGPRIDQGERLMVCRGFLLEGMTGNALSPIPCVAPPFFLMLTLTVPEARDDSCRPEIPGPTKAGGETPSLHGAPGEPPKTGDHGARGAAGK